MISLPGKREIYEKTLELNVCAELLSMIRTQPGYQKAVWQGLTQAQERAAGLDEMIRNVGTGKHLMLQFKAPWASSPVETVYKFSINTDQHRTLEAGLAATFPNAVFYVFPLYTSWRKVYNFAPSLVKDTWLLRISDVNSSSLGLFQKRHRVEVRKQTVPPRAWIFSPEIDTNLLNAQEAFESASDLLPLQDLVPSETLMEWVHSSDIVETGRTNRDSFPRFRGLYSLFIPSLQQG